MGGAAGRGRGGLCGCLVRLAERPGLAPGHPRQPLVRRPRGPPPFHSPSASLTPPFCPCVVGDCWISPCLLPRLLCALGFHALHALLLASVFFSWLVLCCFALSFKALPPPSDLVCSNTSKSQAFSPQCREVAGLRLIKVRNPWGHGEWTGAPSFTFSPPRPSRCHQTRLNPNRTQPTAQAHTGQAQPSQAKPAQPQPPPKPLPSPRPNRTGAYSDHSPLWTPGLRAAVGLVVADDGTFWMCYEDFCSVFANLYLCSFPPNPATVQGPIPFFCYSATVSLASFAIPSSFCFCQSSCLRTPPSLPSPSCLPHR